MQTHNEPVVNTFYQMYFISSGSVWCVQLRFCVESMKGFHDKIKSSSFGRKHWHVLWVTVEGMSHFWVTFVYNIVAVWRMKCCVFAVLTDWFKGVFYSPKQKRISKSKPFIWCEFIGEPEHREQMMFPTVNWAQITIPFQRSWRKEAIEKRMFNFYALTDRHQSGYCVVWKEAQTLTQDLGGNV